MKKHYILSSTIVIIILLFITGFSSSKSKIDFLEIYADSNYTIYSRRESSNSSWIKWQYPTKKVKNKSGKYVIAGGNTKMQLWKCNCYSKNYDINYTIEHDRNGKVISSSKNAFYDNPVIPESIGEVIFQHICANNDESFYNYNYEMDSTEVTIDSTAYLNIK